MTTLDAPQVAQDEMPAVQGVRSRLRRRPPQRRAPRPPRPAGPPGRVETTGSVVSTATTMVALVASWMVLQLLVLGASPRSAASPCCTTSSAPRSPPPRRPSGR
ncbi:hypothetical protein [Nocardioides humi]|uniref:hypothetical protein n=1 Tax=Nocardioides humi TaxID=449461 RepID=UPI001128BCD7|nr:hypothetical protein [Nocardioides humi]